MSKDRKKDAQGSSPRPASREYAAAKIGVSLPTLDKLIEEGKLRSYKVGKRRLISEEAITDCIALLECSNLKGVDCTELARRASYGASLMLGAASSLPAPPSRQ